MSRARMIGAGLLLALGCGPDEVAPVSSEPPLTGEPLYHEYPGLCHSNCWDSVLYLLDGDVVELRVHDGSEFIGMSSADLRPEAAAEFDALRTAAEAALAAGELDEQPSCVVFDAATMVLYLGEHELSYPHLCPPADVAELDQLLRRMLDDLNWCQASTRLSPRIGCEVRMPWVSETDG